MPGNGFGGSPAVGTKWVSGALYFFDRATGNTIAQFNPGTQTLTIPSGATLDASAGTTVLGNTVENTIAVVAALGNSQGSAAPLTADLNAITGADGTKGVALPSAVVGLEISVYNTDATNVLKIYPFSAAAINALGANVALSIQPGQLAIFAATSVSQWYTDAGVVTVGRMAALARGSIISGQTGNVPAALAAATSGRILVGDGTDLNSVPVSGDATLAASGAVTIANAPATGRVAVGLVDFDATGDCTAVVVGAVTYSYNVAPTVTSGQWAYGASAANSATNLAAGINGDTRNAGGPYYIAAVGAGGTTVFIFALAAGTAGNVSVSRTAGANPDVVNNLLGGVAVGAKRLQMVAHTVTAEEGTQVECNIPLPFVPTVFTVQYRTSAGVIKAVTDAATIGTSPNRINIVSAGATHIASTDVVTITAME